MIFVTVGDQMPFDRLIRIVDRWAVERGRPDVFAQVGAGGWEPPHLRWTQRLEPAEFKRHLEAAAIVVAHAGMGTILSALYSGKPLLVFPRRGELRETRNDHQVATARHFAGKGVLEAAFSEAELVGKLDHLQEFRSPHPIGAFAAPQLLAAVRDFLAS